MHTEERFGYTLCETESDSAYRDLLKLEALVYDIQALVYDIQALVYGILPSTTATLDYAIGLEKLSANSFSLMLKWQ